MACMKCVLDSSVALKWVLPEADSGRQFGCAMSKRTALTNFFRPKSRTAWPPPNGRSESKASPLPGNQSALCRRRVDDVLVGRENLDARNSAEIAIISEDLVEAGGVHCFQQIQIIAVQRLSL